LKKSFNDKEDGEEKAMAFTGNNNIMDFCEENELLDAFRGKCTRRLRALIGDSWPCHFLHEAATLMHPDYHHLQLLELPEEKEENRKKGRKCEVEVFSHYFF
jgi:hypothetical protein